MRASDRLVVDRKRGQSGVEALGSLAIMKRRRATFDGSPTSMAFASVPTLGRAR